MTGRGSIFASGFLSDPSVRTALVVGFVVAVVSAMVGTFTVIRGQSFAGHSLADIGTAGGSGAFLAGVPAIYGFLAVNLAAAAAMDVIGGGSSRTRDLATGIVLGAALGLAGLLLYEDTITTSTTGAAVNVLFGSIFSLQPSVVPVVAALSAAAVGLSAILYRPLILSSVSPELAAARGVRVRMIAVCYLLAVAIAVSLSAITVGAILATALLIGPPATAQRLVSSIGRAIALAAIIGVAAVWLGILLAYDSVSWTRGGQGWPVSFFIVAAVFTAYAVAQLATRAQARRQRPAPVRRNG